MIRWLVIGLVNRGLGVNLEGRYRNEIWNGHYGSLEGVLGVYKCIMTIGFGRPAEELFAFQECQHCERTEFQMCS